MSTDFSFFDTFIFFRFPGRNFKKTEAFSTLQTHVWWTYHFSKIVSRTISILLPQLPKQAQVVPETDQWGYLQCPQQVGFPRMLVHSIRISQPQLVAVNSTETLVRCTILQKLSKCEVKAWLFWNLMTLLPLRFCVKSNFGEFKQSKNVILTIFEALNFDFSKFEQLSSPKSTKI